MNALVSVVIPVYNVEPYLKECLDSVSRQDYPNYKVLLVDDGSTDESGIICQEFSKKYGWTYFKNQNRGVSYSRNFSLDYVDTEFISFIDSDDIIPTNYLSCMFKAQEIEDADVVVCPHKEFFNIENLPTNDQQKIIKTVASYDYFRDLLTRNLPSGMGIALHNKLFRTNLFTNVRFPEDMVYEDNYTFFDIMNGARGICLTNETYYFYRKRKDSIVTKITDKSNHDWIASEARMLSQISTKYPDLINDANARLAESYMVLLYRVLRQPGAKIDQNVRTIQQKIISYKQEVLHSRYSTKKDKMLFVILTNRVLANVLPSLLRGLTYFRKRNYQ